MIPVPVNKVEGVIFSKKYNFTIEDKQVLKPYSIGIKIGIKYAEIYTEGLNVKKYPEYGDIFWAVSLGKCDFALAGRVAGLYELKSEKIPDLYILGEPVIERKLYHYLHKKNADLVPKITKVLKKMQEKGTIDAIREKAIKDLLDN